MNIGDVFGRLTVISDEFYYEKYKWVKVSCSCGTVKDVRVSSLESGSSNSCGCLAKELQSERVTTHGQSRHRLYSVWHDMNRRCFNKERKDYKHYGGRGITVCDRWCKDNPEGLSNFIEDMFDSYEEGLEIDRVNVNGNYEPANCRWATRKEQVMNRRKRKKSKLIYQYLEDNNMSTKLYYDRINKLGWDEEKAKTPETRTKRYWVKLEDNSLVTLKNYLEARGISYVKWSNTLRKFGIGQAKIIFDISNCEIFAEKKGNLIKV